MKAKKSKTTGAQRREIAARALLLQAEQSMKLLETARRHLRMLKAEHKQARKAFKQAKKAAKRARKAVKAATVAVKPALKANGLKKESVRRRKPVRAAETKKSHTNLDTDLRIALPLAEVAALHAAAARRAQLNAPGDHRKISSA